MNIDTNKDVHNVRRDHRLRVTSAGRASVHLLPVCQKVVCVAKGVTLTRSRFAPYCL